MFVVVVTYPKDNGIYGPFPSRLHAADWASCHRAETNKECRVVSLLTPPFYGENL